MKLKVTDKEVISYRLEIEGEKDGQTFYATIWYDPHDGYEVTFADSMGRHVETPQWAKDLEEDSETCHSLGYWLEDQLEGRFSWTNREVANA
jgi:hypothetical protein